jgi:hypothetical protein
METAKQVVALLVGIVGLITAVLPLYARFMDKKKRTTSGSRPADRPRNAADGPVEVIPVLEPVSADSRSVTRVIAVSRPRATAAVLEYDDVAEEPVADPKAVERARRLVKAPAIALLTAGFLGLALNVLVAGYGFIDVFITPLDTNSRDGAQGTPALGGGDRSGVPENREQDRGTKILTIITMCSLSLACAMALWAGFSMINLKNYRLSMAGCLAVMPGALFCCLAGMPVGIWSLTVLLRPDVRSSFS